MSSNTQILRVRSTENNSDLGYQKAFIWAPYFELSADGSMSWEQFKKNMYKTAVTLGDASLNERRRQKRAMGRDASGRVPLAVGIFSGLNYALVAPIDMDISNDITEAEVVPYDFPNRW